MIRLIFLIFFCQQLVGASQIVGEDEVSAFLIPSDHPIKTTLDALFSSGRWNKSEKSLKKGGFEFSAPREFTHLVIARHPLVPGYVFKIYLDTQRYYSGSVEYHWWVLRVRGAELIRDLIAKQKWEDEFKVPQKWIYKLPAQGKKSKDYLPKNYILVEEDMELYPHAENKAMWKSDFITKSLLDKVFYILKEIGLSDCAKIDNIPFSQDGKIAFIDTQTFHVDHEDIHYDSLTGALNKDNQAYWKLLYEKK